MGIDDEFYKKGFKIPFLQRDVNVYLKENFANKDNSEESEIPDNRNLKAKNLCNAQI